MPANKHKSGRTKRHQGQPPNCWEWLRHAGNECWELTFRQYREDKKEMAVLGGLRPMIPKNDADRAKARENVWRHSYASYLLAKEKNFAPVAYIMQHTRSTTTEIYKGCADELDALRYFAITPASVLMTWEEFCASVGAPEPEDPKAGNDVDEESKARLIDVKPPVPSPIVREPTVHTRTLPEPGSSERPKLRLRDAVPTDGPDWRAG